MKDADIEQTNLFGNGAIVGSSEPVNREETFNDYGKFVDKFKPKKTTDDCYTPKDVYNAVVEYVRGIADIDDCTIERPFSPGGDYESVQYSEDSVVIDNPPFSIITKIVRYYLQNKVKFFLFAPHLTLFSTAHLHGCSSVVASCVIEYSNGAKVRTSFLTNLIDYKIITAPTLHKTISEIQKKTKTLPKYKYNQNVLTVSNLSKLVTGGVELCVPASEVVFCRRLDSQKKYKKTIFGSGFLVSDKIAADKIAADKIAADKTVEIKKIPWELSQRERDLIDNMKG